MIKSVIKEKKEEDNELVIKSVIKRKKEEDNELVIKSVIKRKKEEDNELVIKSVIKRKEVERNNQSILVLFHGILNVVLIPIFIFHLYAIQTIYLG